MRWRQVGVLYLVAGAMGVAYWAGTGRPVPVVAVHPARRRFLEVEVGQVRELRLARGGRTVVFRRDGERWTVVEPPDAAIPPDLVAAFVAALAGAEEIDVVDSTGVDPQSYGLDEQAARVEVVVEPGVPLLVTIGNPNPTGTAVYARGAAARGIVLIGRTVRYYEDLIFQALPGPQPPAVEQGLPVGG